MSFALPAENIEIEKYKPHYQLGHRKDAKSMTVMPLMPDVPTIAGLRGGSSYEESFTSNAARSTNTPIYDHSSL